MSKEKFDYFIKGEKGKYEVVIGLEVHAQVLSKSKLFSGSSTKFGADPNNQVSLIDSAFPGMLPVINEECVKQAVRTGLGLNAKINNYSVFDRKNYFYADLPQGYQISQYKNPLVGEGKVLLDMPYGSKEIGIERLHLEQDAGKSIHDMDPSNTYVDLNRSGIALMEIVSRPDLRSPDEVNAYIKKLRSIMRYLGTCDGNMQEGSLRADVNVSVRKQGDKNFRTLSQAALAGGVTSIVTMPNTKPIIDNVSMVDFIIRRGRDKAKINLFPCATITRQKEGEQMTEFGLLKAGKEKLFGFFVGQVMKLSGGKANPQLTNEILKKLLKG